ncbi:MAG: DUF262 domain-containing protein [Defluviitaleaceae bacterium]|nr:DUF262 domain-containing protein [Defluviitaleaceae bacterium]
MNNIIDDSITIYEALQHIKSGKYIMPAFQRQFVWNMEQIEKLWDSILLNYPIATFLYWRVDESNVTTDTYFCDFLREVVFNNRKDPDSTNYELTNIDTNITDTAILDGQQRLTALYISLYGEGNIRPKHARKKTGEKIITKLLIELNKNKLTTDEEEYNSMKFDIKFHAGRTSPTHFDLKKILDDKFQNDATRVQAIEDAITTVPTDSKDYARNILQTLHRKIFVDKMVRYTEILDMKQDDALEMFVRFNSGGKALRKSEITMSILEAYWPSAKTEFGRLLTGSYEGFGTDFIIRTALMLYGDVVKSNISKKIAEELKNNWTDFKQALVSLDNLLKGLKIEIGRFSHGWNVLLPIIYFIYHNPDYDRNIDAVRAYLLRAIFFTYFQSGTTSKLQQMKSHINENELEITVDMLDRINDLRVTEAKIEDVVNSEKGSRVAGEVLYYLSLEWLNKTFKYEQDHLHPDNKFNNKPHTIPMEIWRNWRGNRNRLPNLHLLVGVINAQKSDMRLIDFFNDMTDSQKTEFYHNAMIPVNVSLEIEAFEKFYEARKALITSKIRELLG